MEDSVTLYFDGGSKGNPGRTAGGWCIDDSDGNEIAHGWHYVGPHSTNNEGEYHGLLGGLMFLKKEGFGGNVLVRGDSKLVIEQAQGRWKCRAENLRPLLERVTELMRGMRGVSFEHIPRAQNSRADGFANQGMLLKSSIKK